MLPIAIRVFHQFEIGLINIKGPDAQVTQATSFWDRLVITRINYVIRAKEYTISRIESEHAPKHKGALALAGSLCE